MTSSRTELEELVIELKQAQVEFPTQTKMKVTDRAVQDWAEKPHGTEEGIGEFFCIILPWADGEGDTTHTFDPMAPRLRDIGGSPLEKTTKFREACCARILAPMLKAGEEGKEPAALGLWEDDRNRGASR